MFNTSYEYLRWNKQSLKIQFNECTQDKIKSISNSVSVKETRLSKFSYKQITFILSFKEEINLTQIHSKVEEKYSSTYFIFEHGGTHL